MRFRDPLKGRFIGKIEGEMNGVPERIRTSDLWIRSRIKKNLLIQKFTDRMGEERGAGQVFQELPF